MLSELKNIGLSDKEAKVYLALLELGKSSVQDLAKRAKVNRATAYVILESLMKMGLVSKYDEGKKTYFIAEAPERLSVFVDKERVEIENKEREIKSLIPKLESLRQGIEEGPVVRYFEGKEGLKLAVKEILNSSRNQKIRMFYNVDALPRFFSEKEREEFRLIRKKRGNQTKVIYISKSISLPEKKEGDERYRVSENDFPTECDIAIYDNKIRIASFSGKNPVGIIIEDESIKEAFLSLFELAFEGAKHRRIK